MRARTIWGGLAVAVWLGIALPVAAQPTPTPTPTSPADGTSRPSIRREDGKTTLEFSEGSLTISSRMQLRWTQEMPESTVGGGSGGLVPSAPAVGDRGSFRIRRAKTELEGWLWNKNLTYELQLSWAGPEPGASTQTPLEDLMLTWDVSRNGTFMITGGQFKVPFGRQEHTTSSRLQFLDRDILSGEMTRGRDVGIQLSGRLGGTLEYKAGIFNGNPASRVNNENDKYQFDARVMYMPLGEFKYSESDFETTDRPLLAIAAQFEHNDQHGSTNADDFKTSIVGGDVAFKFKGFSAFAEYFARRREPETTARFDSPGFHAQAGYFLVRDKWEVALRYATYDPSDAIPDNDRIEMGGALSYFVRRHLLKVQADFRQIEDEARGDKDKELRVQTAVVF
jgi:phosphate-selective porin OprO and OprP